MEKTVHTIMFLRPMSVIAQALLKTLAPKIRAIPLYISRV